jgi:hypothetical protein
LPPSFGQNVDYLSPPQDIGQVAFDQTVSTWTHIQIIDQAAC